jgi:MoaA/NifB/PqqE/SkfB family radical SAM enzyme
MEQYHRSRSIDHQPFRSACYAPYVGLTFDPRGTVSVCGFTRTTPLGTIGESRLVDMWRGPELQRLRAAVRDDDLHAFCGRCAEEIEGGNLHGVFARGFDDATLDPAWPTRMEFSLSTACNLECVMCSGEFSSAIRTRREGLPPRTSPYGEAFVDELTPFLPRLAQARFLGGEPFLADINHRIWERMIELGSTAECNVTTNGTVFTPRVERLLATLRFSVCVSVDGATSATVESIRAGASHRRILEHLHRFLEHRERHGTVVSLSYCLMVQNWFEFADFLRFAEGLGCQVFVNTVRQPAEHSLYRLDDTELERVVAALQARRDDVAATLVLNRIVWLEQLERLAQHLAQRRENGASSVLPGPTPAYEQFVERAAAAGDGPQLLALLEQQTTAGGVGWIDCDAEERIRAAPEHHLGLAAGSVVGRSAGDYFVLLADRLGRQVDVVAERVAHGVVARVVQFSAEDSTTRLGVVTVAAGDGTRRYTCVLATEQVATPVVLRRRPG